MIIMEDVTKTYSTGVAALNGINLHIQKGEFVFIVGKSVRVSQLLSNYYLRN